MKKTSKFVSLLTLGLIFLFIGSVAAAIQVGKVGNTPLQKSELLEELSYLLLVLQYLVPF